MGATHKEKLNYGIRKWIDPIRVAGPNASYPADGGGLIGSSFVGVNKEFLYGYRETKEPRGKIYGKKVQKNKEFEVLIRSE